MLYIYNILLISTLIFDDNLHYYMLSCLLHQVVVAAACMQLSRETATINFIGATGIPSVKLMLLSQLLAKIETVARGHGIITIVAEVPEWSEDTIEWITRCGFEDKSGYISTDSNFTKQTMILQFQKSIRVSEEAIYQRDETLPAADDICPADAVLEEIQHLSLDGHSGDIDGRPPPAMESLFLDIFRALHSENPEPLPDDA